MKNKKLKFEKFSKLSEVQKMAITFMIGIFLTIGCITLYKTFAIYKEEKTFYVIEGIVPNFTKKDKDLEIAIMVDGENRTEIPEGKEYRVNVECDDENLKVSWDYSKWDLSLSGFTTSTSCSVKFESIYNSIKLNNEEVKEFPEKDNYTIKMTCENTESYNWDKETWKPVVEGINKDSACTLEFDSPTEFYNEASIGDYVAYTPSNTSYDINNELTGIDSYTGSDSTALSIKDAGKQTINPSELSLWRIIKKSDNGSIEIVSENISDSGIYFYGKEGYNNYIKSLRELVKGYETNEITIDSRPIGYNGQTEIVNIDISSITRPLDTFTCNIGSTGSTCHGNRYEEQGGGDIMYEKDLELLKEAYKENGSCTDYQHCKRLVAYNKNGNNDYAIAGRNLGNCAGGTNDSFQDNYSGVFFSSNGYPSGLCYSMLLLKPNEWREYLSNLYYMRPIVVLKSGLTASQSEKDGKKLWTVN